MPSVGFSEGVQLIERPLVARCGGVDSCRVDRRDHGLTGLEPVSVDSALRHYEGER